MGHPHDPLSEGAPIAILLELYVICSECMGNVAQRCKTVEKPLCQHVENTLIPGLLEPNPAPFSMRKLAKLSFVAGAELPKKHIVA
jgi:hypothetical protein